MSETSPILSFEALKETILATVTPSYCYGTLPLALDKGSLFFKTENGSDFLNFGEPELQEAGVLRLVKASQRATFGRDGRDVLDETYRKAWKLDTSEFSAQFDVVRSGILKIVTDQLLRYEKSNLALEAELYKLNVYGPGSFFKPHVDTPRSDQLFATLVIVLPTTHAGGNLLLGDGGSIFDFDSANLLYDPATKASQVAWAAFYSDIAHEVLPVESGHRVTLTYNLHLSQSTSFESVPRGLSSDSFTKLIKTLAQYIAAPNVLPTGGALGFGLLHRYPVVVNSSLDLAAFTGALKGNDAILRNACQRLGMTVSVNAMYKAKPKYRTHERSWVADRVLKGEDLGYEVKDIKREFTRVAHLVIRDPSEQTEEEKNAYNSDEEYEIGRVPYRDAKADMPVIWVTPPTRMLEASMAYMAYGNEASLGHIYGDLILTARMTSFETRLPAMKQCLEQLGMDVPIIH